MKQHRILRLAALCLGLSTTFVSCKKEDLAAPSTQTTDPSTGLAAGMTTTNALATTATTSGTAPYSRVIDWNNRANGYYGLTQANTDLGSTAYWSVSTASQTQTVSNMLRATLLKNTTSGVMSKVDIPDGAEYTVTYDMQFASDFDFAGGGKIGFGLLLGDGNTGGDPGWDGNGGSLRLGWTKNSSGNVVLTPDVYYKDQPGSYGNSFGVQYPASGSLQKGVWYKVAMYIKSNTGSNTDGSVQLTINGTSVLNKTIRWTTNDLKRLVNNVCFENFRTGATSAYDGNVLFDNVTFTAAAPSGTATSSTGTTGTTGTTGSTGSTGTTGTVSPTVAPTPTPTPTTTGISTKTINWDGRPNGNYGLTQAISDFGNANYWQQNSASQSQVYNGMLKTTLLANSLTNGGVLSRSNITPGSEYELSFDMQFASNFDFSWGGKVGYGFFIGDGNTGGDPAWDGNGGSLRIMWYKNTSTSPIILKPYVYYKDQPGTYGNDFGKAYPSNGTSIQKGVWYNVKMYIKSNTGSNTDGRARIVINGVTILDQAIRWTTNDLKRLVNTLAFETFRGGGETYWQSSTNGDIYFDNLKLTQLAR